MRNVNETDFLQEDHGVHQKPSHKVRERVQGLKTVGGNIMSKPKEFAHKLRHRFGSADNLTTLHEKEILKESRNPLGSSSLPRYQWLIVLKI